MMNARSWFGVAAVAMVLMAVACADKAPTAPSMAVEVSGADQSAVTTYPLVTLNSDMTVSPAWVSVPAGGKIRMYNSTTRLTIIQSSNCWEFSLMALYPGVTRSTQAFSPGGKTCDYWAMSSGQKIFVGRVVVQ